MIISSGPVKKILITLDSDNESVSLDSPQDYHKWGKIHWAKLSRFLWF